MVEWTSDLDVLVGADLFSLIFSCCVGMAPGTVLGIERGDSNPSHLGIILVLASEAFDP